MTPAGFEAADTELKQLKSSDRPNVIKAIAEAREHGDLSENAEYHSARELQGQIEARIKELEGLVSKADIIDVTKLSGAVKFGATVEIVDEDTDEEKTYKIVGEDEADATAGLISVFSPLARVMIGKKNGDVVEFQTPKGERELEVVDFSFK